MTRMSWCSKLSLVSSGLIAAASVVVILAHVVLPITLETVYTGPLTAIGAMAFGAIALLILIGMTATAIAKLVVHEHISRLVAAAFAFWRAGQNGKR